MTRVLSALVLLPAVVGIAWFLPPIYTTILIGIVVALAFDEYARMARLGSEGFPRPPTCRKWRARTPVTRRSRLTRYP